MIGVIRDVDVEGFTDVGLMSYAVLARATARFAMRSAAVGRSRAKKTTMDGQRQKGCARSSLISRRAPPPGKPGLPYLDMVCRKRPLACQPSPIRSAASMLRLAAAENGWLDHDRLLETLLFKRAGRWGADLRV